MISALWVQDIKAYKICAGENHSIIITEDGCVYTWGNGSYGKLGNASSVELANEVFQAPVEIQKYILEQFAKTLPHDQQARRTFVQSGGLQFVCQLAEDADGKLAEHIKGIQDCYPPENFFCRPIGNVWNFHCYRP